jgi:hypothetical protein
MHLEVFTFMRKNCAGDKGNGRNKFGIDDSEDCTRCRVYL